MSEAAQGPMVPGQSARPRIAVIGPGALGTLFAARLALSGTPVRLLDYRVERAARLTASGLQLTDASGVRQAHVPVTADPRDLADADAALVLVKAYQTEQVAQVLAEHLPPRAVVLTLQNGLGNVETLQMHLGSDRVYGGTTTQGAALEAPGQVRDTGPGMNVLGRMDGQPDARLDDLAQALLLANFAVAITNDLPAAIWTKAIVNAAINPVAALTRLRNGALVQQEDTLKLMTAAAREGAAIAAKQGVQLGEQDWRARLQAVCQATAPNINSMLADVLHGRRTEVDAINGAIVRAAELHDVPVSVNRTLWYLIRTAERGHAEQVTL